MTTETPADRPWKRILMRVLVMLLLFLLVAAGILLAVVALSKCIVRYLLKR